MHFSQRPGRTGRARLDRQSGCTVLALCTFESIVYASVYRVDYFFQCGHRSVVFSRPQLRLQKGARMESTCYIWAGRARWIQGLHISRITSNETAIRSSEPAIHTCTTDGAFRILSQLEPAASCCLRHNSISTIGVSNHSWILQDPSKGLQRRERPRTALAHQQRRYLGSLTAKQNQNIYHRASALTHIITRQKCFVGNTFEYPDADRLFTPGIFQPLAVQTGQFLNDIRMRISKIFRLTRILLQV